MLKSGERSNILENRRVENRLKSISVVQGIRGGSIRRVREKPVPPSDCYGADRILGCVITQTAATILKVGHHEVLAVTHIGKCLLQLGIVSGCGLFSPRQKALKNRFLVFESSFVNLLKEQLPWWKKKRKKKSKLYYYKKHWWKSDKFKENVVMGIMLAGYICVVWWLFKWSLG